MKKFDINTPQDVQLIVKNMRDNCKTRTDVEEFFGKCTYNFALSRLDLIRCALLFYDKDYNVESSSVLPVFVTGSEINFLKAINDDSQKKFLAALLLISRWHDHPSGWIQFNEAECFTVAGLNIKTTAAKRAVIRACCDDKLLDFRVVGSKNPIVCFQLAYRDDDCIVKKEVCSVDEVLL